MALDTTELMNEYKI